MSYETIIRRARQQKYVIVEHRFPRPKIGIHPDPKNSPPENGPHIATRCSKGGVPRSMHQGQNKKKKLISELLYCKSG